MAGQLVKAVVQFTALVVLSHLLSPRDIGLITMLAVFVMLGELIRDFGLTQAAIQTPKLSHGQASNLFWSNTVVGIVLTLSLALAAPSVASLYNEPALRGLAPVVALTFTINALQAQFQVRLARDLRFLALTITDSASQVVGLAAGVAAALAGAGYWSLAVQMLSIYGSLLVQRALIARWRPGLPRREAGMSALYLFGLHSGLAQLVNYGASNADSYTIGIRWGADALGIYNRAFQIFSAPASQLLGPLTNVALPLLSRRRHEGGDFYPLLWKAQVSISVALTFAFALIGSLAEPLVRVALGPGWGESAPLLTILSIGGAVQVLSYMAFWAFLSSGNARQLFLHSLVTKPLLVVCILVGSAWGLQGVAWGFSAGLAISWFISLAWLKRCDGMPAFLFLRSGLHVILCGVVAGSVAWSIVRNFDSQVNTFATFFCGAALVASIYIPLVLLNASSKQFICEMLGAGLSWAKTAVRGRRTERNKRPR